MAIFTKDLKVKYGRFHISHQDIRDYPKLVMMALGRCVVTDCSHLFHSDQIEYTAVSYDFDDLQEEEPVPLYRVIYDRAEEQIKFVRQDNK
jgi:hypothetical protein